MKAPDLDRDAAVDLAAAVRRKAISPTELVDAFIARIEAVNPALNAVVDTRFDAARREAKAATELLATADADDLPPFFGVPCTIKECFGLAGMRHTAGSLRRRDKRADVDGAAAARMRDAGFIPLGLTNVPEMAFYYETDNLVYGRTHNPYDLSRSVGGSSGGEGAIVGAGASPIGLGSDVGGSIRMPAVFCGLFGHKPTGGSVPGTGHIPAPSPGAARFSCHGPLCRSAKDILPVMRALAGPDGVDVGVLPVPPSFDAIEITPSELVVHVIDEAGWVKPSDAVRTAVWQAAKALERDGARLHHARPPELGRGFEVWAQAMQEKNSDGRSFIEWLGDGDDVDVGREILRAVLGKGRHTMPALLFAALEGAGKKLPLVKKGGDLRASLEDKLRQLLPERNHVILTPAFPVQAFPHGTGHHYPAAFVYAGLWNVLEMPSTAVPLGLCGHGLPLGLQVVGRRGDDAVTVAVAAMLEERLAGRVPPTLKP